MGDFYYVPFVVLGQVKENSETLAKYLQYKIGYIGEDNKAYGMCSSVLSKCQNYTFTDGKYNNNNQVIKEYLQRTLTQIKVAQDEIINSYAENCISDVDSCLNSNNYSGNDNYAINACKSQIVTCMSVNGDATKDPKPAYIEKWVNDMQNAKNGQKTSTITYVLFDGATWQTSPTTTVTSGTTFTLPKSTDIYAPYGGLGNYAYWCFGTTGTCVAAGTTLNATQVDALINSGATLYLSLEDETAACKDLSGTWSDTGCTCGTSRWYGSSSGCQK